MPRKGKATVGKQERTLRTRFRKVARALALWLVAGVLLYGAYDLYRYMVKSDLFVIRQVRIQGNHLLLEEEIFAILEIPSRIHLWQVKPDRIEAQLLKVSSVRSVEVQRVLPETLVIDISERNPIADWRDPRTGKLYAVDEETVILAESEEMDRRLLRSGDRDTAAIARPQITGIDVWGRMPGDRIGAPGLDKLLSSLSVAIARNEDWVRTVRSIGAENLLHGWVFRCGSEDREIRLGNRNFLERIGKIDPVWRMLLREHLQVAYIDLRFEEQGILVKPLNCDPAAWAELAGRYPVPKGVDEFSGWTNG